jgi:3(or 17)beta-hydroxysteroid dehydrogenase
MSNADPTPPVAPHAGEGQGRGHPQVFQQVACVTGGASGLGKAVAQRLAVGGAKVVITDIQHELGESTAAECGFAFFQQDVCDEERWVHLVAAIEARFGHLDILVNNAGVLGRIEGADPESTSLSSWRHLLAVNVEGVFLGRRAAIPAMRRAGHGSIVNLSSIADRLATPYATAYGASKAAVRHLTRSVAQHCAEQRLNVRCNSVHPGMIGTPMLEQSIQEMADRRGLRSSESSPT